MWSFWIQTPWVIQQESANKQVVRDALEQIDLIKLMIKETVSSLVNAGWNKDFQYCWSSTDVKEAFGAGKFATLIGVEGWAKPNSTEIPADVIGRICLATP